VLGRSGNHGLAADCDAITFTVGPLVPADAGGFVGWCVGGMGW
jgi:hypothetical protein